MFPLWLAYIIAFMALAILSQLLHLSPDILSLFLTFPVVVYNLVQRQSEKSSKEEK